jgi:hypothetical protein
VRVLRAVHKNATDEEPIRTRAFRTQATDTEPHMPEIEIPEPCPRDRTTLFKLRTQQCRFIVSEGSSETIFCGAQTYTGSSWCPWHRQLVYARPPDRSQKKSD